jgi:hypothetical protein
VSARGLRQGAWSVQELDRLRQLLPWRGVDGAAALLRRSSDSVRKRAARMFKTASRRGEWSEDDDTLLRIAWGAVEPRLLGTMLGRPSADVARRASALRSKQKRGEWTHEEHRLLKRLYGTRADEDLEVSFQRRADDIAAKAKQMCLQKDKRFACAQSDNDAVRASRAPRWSTAEVAMLRAAYRDHDNLEVAKKLGRSVVSVANKAWQLGLQKSAAALARIGRANVAHRFESEA